MHHVISYTTYSFSSFFSSLCQLFIALPIRGSVILVDVLVCGRSLRPSLKKCITKSTEDLRRGTARHVFQFRVLFSLFVHPGGNTDVPLNKTTFFEAHFPRF